MSMTSETFPFIMEYFSFGKYLLLGSLIAFRFRPYLRSTNKQLGVLKKVLTFTSTAIVNLNLKKVPLGRCQTIYNTSISSITLLFAK